MTTSPNIPLSLTPAHDDGLGAFTVGGHAPAQSSVPGSRRRSVQTLEEKDEDVPVCPSPQDGEADNLFARTSRRAADEILFPAGRRPLAGNHPGRPRARAIAARGVDPNRGRNSPSRQALAAGAVDRSGGRNSPYQGLRDLSIIPPAAGRMQGFTGTPTSPSDRSSWC